MTHGNNNFGDLDRRRFLKNAMGAAGVGMIAGCIGGGDSGEQEVRTVIVKEEGEEVVKTVVVTPTEEDLLANYPQQPIVWINPSGPEGGFGAHGFALIEVLPKYLPNDNADIVLESIGSWPGGTAKIERSDPDGFTIGFGNVPGVIVNQVIGGLDYDLSTWSWIARTQQASYTLYVTVDSPFETVEDLQNAGTIKVGRFGGTGTLVNLLTFSTLGVEFETVPGYQGGGDVYSGLLRGDIDVLAYSDGSTIPVNGVADGEIRPIATLWSDVPQHLVDQGHGDIPTMEDLGYDSLVNFGLNRLVGAPPGLDKDIQDTLTEAFLNALNDDDFLAWAEQAKFPVHPGGQEDCIAAVENSISIIEEKRDFLSQFYG